MKKKFNLIYDKIVRNKTKLFLLLLLVCTATSFGQPRPNPSTENWITSPGILGTLLLIGIVLLVAILIIYYRISEYVNRLRQKDELEDKTRLTEKLIGLNETEIDTILEKRKAALTYNLSGNELGSSTTADDKRGVVTKVTHEPNNPVVDEKREL